MTKTPEPQKTTRKATDEATIMAVSFFISICICIAFQIYVQNFQKEIDKYQEQIKQENSTEHKVESPVLGEEEKNIPQKEESNKITSIASYMDCSPEYNPEFGAFVDVNVIKGSTFIAQSFDGQSQKVGWCLYMIDNETTRVIGGGPSWKPIGFISLIQDEHLLFGQSCGTECYYITALNINNPEDELGLGSTPYFEFSSDEKWLVFYKRQLYRQLKDSHDKNVTDDEFTNYFMATAVNLNTFEKNDFAPNPYFQDGSILDIDSYNNYWIDVHSMEHDTGFDFIDEVKQIVRIPFKNQLTGEREIRMFDMKNDFTEIPQY
ncbi:hypothetical protein JW766_01580 [Candidatus Dojkabacteria bacterium]|nr:hypothetical protein [Candidatus Dojkabacteria bacterium]